MVRGGRVGIIVILCIAAALRLYQLGTVPHGFTHDEMGYVYNSYSIATTGSNVFGERLPLMTWMVQGGFPFMPVPTYLMAPLYWVFPATPFVARLGYALLGIGSVYLLYVLARKLYDSEYIALVSAFILSISPWHLQFTRSAYDPTVSVFFYLLAITLLVYAGKRTSYIGASVVSLTLAVYSYRGMSMIYLPLSILSLWYIVKTKKTLVNTSWVRMVVAGVTIITVLYIGTVLHYGSRYTAEAASLFTDTSMQQFLDTQIRDATGPLQIRRVFLNKPVFIVSKMIENYVRVFSPEYLLLYSEPSQIYSLWMRGRILFIDGIMLIIGFTAMWAGSKHRRQAMFLSGMVAVSAIPAALGGMPYSARALFLVVPFAIATGYGIVRVVTYPPSRLLRGAVVASIALIYLYSTAHYLFDYYGRYAHTKAEHWAKSIRDVTTVAQQRTDGASVTVGPATFGDVVLYAFHAGIGPRDIQAAWNGREITADGADTYSVGAATFVGTCDGVQTGDVLIIAREPCMNDATPSSVIADYYANPIWRVFEQKKE